MPATLWPVNERKDELLARIDASWRELTDVIEGLDAAALEAAGGDGWSVKDHLAHVAMWERSVIALLRGQDRAAEIGLADVDVANLSDDARVDAENEAIRAQHHDQPAADVLHLFHSTHADLLGLLGPMTDADLQRPYSDYQPGETGPHRSNPVVNWVVGNTTEHFAEHAGWIRHQRGAEAAGRSG